MFGVNSKYIVIINEKYKVLSPQENLINEISGGDWGRYGVPRGEFPINFQREMIQNVTPEHNFIFITMVPFLLASLSKSAATVYIMHNDNMYSNRERITLTNGRTMYKMPDEGWQLIKIV